MKIVNGMQEVVSVSDDEAMKLLRDVFPDGKADQANFVLFSTSGVHGTYLTIEEAGTKRPVTFLMIQPRRVMLFFGNAHAKTRADVAFLKKLRKSSHAIVAEIGLP